MIRNNFVSLNHARGISIHQFVLTALAEKRALIHTRVDGGEV